MFIRINTKLETTIFNLSLSTVKEKLELFNTLVKKTKTDLLTIEKNKSPLFLSSVSIFLNSDLDLYNTSAIGRQLLFNDIIGIRNYGGNNTESFYKSNIFDTRNVGSSSYKLRNPPVLTKPTITVEEVKTGQLLKKYNKRDLNNLKQKVTVPETNKVREVGYDHDKETKYLVPVLEEVDHLMIIEGTTTLSELGDILNIMAQLGRNSVNRIYGLYDMYDYLDPGDTLLKILLKYGVTAGNASSQIEFYQRRDRINRSSPTEVVNASVFFENVDHLKLVSDELNIFIPFKLFLFLPNATKLFKDVNTLKVDNSIIDIPSAFSPQRTSFSIGHQNRKADKQQTTGNLLPTLTTNNFKLKNTITYIPSNLSSRLLKSKLKLLEDKRMVLGEYGEVIYNIPKSILDGGYLEDFYFFTKEQTTAINKAKEGSSKYSFNVTIEGMVNLSYYTNGIYNYLLNRFTNDFYNHSLLLTDFVYCPKLLYKEIPNLGILIKELETKQTSLSTTFNNTQQTLLTHEMFLYEKATLLALYLLKKTGWEDSFLRDKHFRNYGKNVLDTIKDNNYNFTQDLLRNGDGYYDLTLVSSVRKAYLFETVYIACNEKSNEELLLWVEQVIADTTILVHRKTDNYRRQFNISVSMLKHLIHTAGDAQGLQYEVDKQLRIFNDTFFSTESKIYFILSQEKSEKLLPLLLVDIGILNYAEILRREILFLPVLLYNCGEPLSVVEGKVTTSFLSDSKQQMSVLDNHFGHNNRGKYLAKYPVLFKTLTESCNIENTDLGVFINMLLTNFDTYYLSSIKNNS
jgi:hypothetical protein